MDLLSSQLDLKSILLSKQTGMDLSQGVPGQKEELKIESQNSFDRHLEETSKFQDRNSDLTSDSPSRTSDSEMLKGSSNSKSEVIQKKNASEVARKADEKEETASAAEESQASDRSAQSAKEDNASQPAPIKQSSKDDSTDKKPAVEEPQAVCQVLLQTLAINEVAKVDPTDRKNDVSLKADGSQLSDAGIQNLGAALQNKTITSMVASQPMGVTPKKNQPTQAKPIDGFDVAAELEKMPELKSAFNTEQASSTNLIGNLETEAPKGTSLKAMVDSLWVQSNLEASNPNQTILVTTPKTVDVSTPNVSASQVRTQLVNDMKPMISNVMTTQNGGEMTLSLRPNNLGLVRVEVKVNAQDVHIAIHAQQSDAKNLLQNQLGDLKQQLSGVGLKVHEVTVHLMRNEGSAFSKNPNAQQQPKQQHDQSSESHRQSHDETGGQFEEALSDGRKVA